MLDTLTLADRLTEAGVEQKQANAIAHAIHDAQGETVRKTDIEHFATKGRSLPRDPASDRSHPRQHVHHVAPPPLMRT